MWCYSHTEERKLDLKAVQLCLMLSSSSLPTHPVPVEAKAEAVELLPHGLDVTEEEKQSSNVTVSKNNER